MYMVCEKWQVHAGMCAWLFFVDLFELCDIIEMWRKDKYKLDGECYIILAFKSAYIKIQEVKEY